MNKAREFDQSVVTELRALLGERVSVAAEVRDVVDICRRHRVPMIAFGVGTSLEGHILAVNGGVSIDLARMNRVLEVHESDLDAVVQAGVTRKQLNEHNKHTGLFFPVGAGA